MVIRSRQFDNSKWPGWQGMYCLCLIHVWFQLDHRHGWFVYDQSFINFVRSIFRKNVLLGIRSKSHIQLHKLFRVIHCVDIYLWSVLKVAAEKWYGLHLMLYNVTCGTGIIFKQPRLTHKGQDKITSNSMTTFSIAFSWMKIFKSRLRFLWIPRKHKWSR